MFAKVNIENRSSFFCRYVQASLQGFRPKATYDYNISPNLAPNAPPPPINTCFVQQMYVKEIDPRCVSLFPLVRIQCQLVWFSLIIRGVFLMGGRGG